MAKTVLSEEQIKARDTIDGQVIVVACPGSGKTTTIINRAVKMVESGISPSSMLNITFTKAAAEEMASRFHAKCDARVNFSTIHSFCFSILRQNFGFTNNDLFSESDKWQFVGDNLRGTVAPAQMDAVIKDVLQGFSYCKNKQLPPRAYQSEKIENLDFCRLYNLYLNYTKKLGKIDFDDMLIIFREKLIEEKKLLELLRSRYKYITVDEFQDVNQIQADICYMLAGDNGNIYVVGDDDQSIYRFRGAESKIMLDFPKKFPKCKQIYLSTNYRCGEDIVEAADELIKHNKVRFDKKFDAFRKDAGDIFLISGDNGHVVAKKCEEEIEKLKKKNIPLNEIAILSRTNNGLLPYVTVLADKKIPFYSSEKITSIHADPIFADIRSYYNLATENEQKGDLLRIVNHPARYIPERKLMGVTFDKDEILKALSGCKDYVKEKAKSMVWDIKALSEKKKPTSFIKYLVTVMQYDKYVKDRAAYLGQDVEERMTVLKMITEEMDRFDTMPQWFSYVEWYEKELVNATKNKNKDGVCLSTFHNAKGLEWKAVFVVGANEGMTPYSLAETESDYEEERRMFYVAITRAKDILYLAYLDNDKSIPSRYLSEMELYNPADSFGGDANRKFDPKKGLGA